MKASSGGKITSVRVLENQTGLSCVYWIGGSPGAGKSTVTRLLATRHNLWAYYFDWHEAAHTLLQQHAPEQFPASDAFFQMSMDERWLLRTPTRMAEHTIAIWTERFRLVLADLETTPPDRGVIIEGSGFFPDCVSRVVSSSHRGIWLVPTQEFVRRVRLTRSPAGMSGTSEPMQALENLIERDILLAEHVVDEANRWGFNVIQIDGSQSIAEIAAQAEVYFGLGEPRSAGSADGGLSVAEGDRFLGHYARPDHRGVRIEREGTRLYMALPSGNPRGLLQSVGNRAFRLEDGPYIGEHVVFQENGVGEINDVVLGPGLLTKQPSDS